MGGGEGLGLLWVHKDERAAKMRSVKLWMRIWREGLKRRIKKVVSVCLWGGGLYVKSWKEEQEIRLSLTWFFWMCGCEALLDGCEACRSFMPRRYSGRSWKWIKREACFLFVTLKFPGQFSDVLLYCTFTNLTKLNLFFYKEEKFSKNWSHRADLTRRSVGLEKGCASNEKHPLRFTH